MVTLKQLEKKWIKRDAALKKRILSELVIPDLDEYNKQRLKALISKGVQVVQNNGKFGYAVKNGVPIHHKDPDRYEAMFLYNWLQSKKAEVAK